MTVGTGDVNWGHHLLISPHFCPECFLGGKLLRHVEALLSPATPISERLMWKTHLPGMELYSSDPIPVSTISELTHSLSPSSF